MATSGASVLRLYRDLMKEGKHFKAYNFREYSQRRIRLGFEENKKESDPEKIKQLYSEGEKELQRLKRMTTINSMYTTKSLVVENTKKF